MLGSFGLVEPNANALNTLRTMAYETARVALGRPRIDLDVARVGDAFVYAVKYNWPYGNYNHNDIVKSPIFQGYLKTLGIGAPGSAGSGGGSYVFDGGGSFRAKDLIAPGIGAAVGFFVFGKKPMGALVGAVAGYFLSSYVKRY